MSIEKQLNEIILKKVGEVQKKGIPDSVVRKVGDEAKQQIIKRTRLGKGVRPQGGGIFDLAGLKDSTIDKRERYDFNLSPFTRPTRSNLTATGQLLDSITYRIFKTGQDKGIELFFKENRRKELEGGPARVRHKDLANYVERGGRPFFYLADFEIEKMKSVLFRELDKV